MKAKDKKKTIYELVQERMAADYGVATESRQIGAVCDVLQELLFPAEKK